MHDIQKAQAFPWAKFPHRVGLHNSCGTLRQLKHAAPSELHEPFFSKPMDLLSKVDGIQFVKPSRPDECCGFGGTFSVFEEVVSTKMGYDKVTDHARAGAEYIVSADSSCLMHQQGCAERIAAESVRSRRDGVPFYMIALIFAAAFGTLAISFWPYMIPFSITIEEAAAPHSSLAFMFWGAGLFVFPLMVLYTVISYAVFRGKVRPTTEYY